MKANLRRDLLRAAALSMALIASGATTALADPPGYYFQDSWQPKQNEPKATPPANAFTAPNDRDAADVDKSTAVAKVDNGPCSWSSSHSAAR